LAGALGLLEGGSLGLEAAGGAGFAAGGLAGAGAGLDGWGAEPASLAGGFLSAFGGSGWLAGALGKLPGFACAAARLGLKQSPSKSG